MKIVINRCHGGFGLSEAGTVAYYARKGIKVWSDGYYPPTYWTIPPQEQPERRNYRDRTLNKEAYRVHAVSNRRNIRRDDPDLVAVVEEMGALADGDHAELTVVEIPDGVEWQIEEYDGLEHIAESHRTWS